ncbi:MAG: flavoprotein [Thermoguttaceae bacterium]|jgi:phosphopantothenoylcysteine synthetase/decarboxylase
MILQGAEILIGVTGGIAAFKTATLVSRLAADGARVSVMMTEAATKLVAPQTFRSLSGEPVRLSLWNDPESAHPHIGVGKNVRIFCIAPATADILAKAANGIADDLLSTTILAFEGPILLAPAMNRVMWSKPATQRNIVRLREDGFHFVGPETGHLACGEEGIGRMAEPETLRRAILEILGVTPKK